MPLWLEQGLRLHAASAGTGGERWASAQLELGLDARTARRYFRLTEFVATHFPQFLEIPEKFRAGSAALLEFIKLHELSPELAREVASGCFGGTLNGDAIRERVRSARPERAETGEAHARAVSARSASFQRAVLERLAVDASILRLPDLDRVSFNEGREPMMPKAVAHTRRRNIAIEIKSPADDGARSLSNVAASLVARIALLRMRFDDAILVMPVGSEAIAAKVSELLKGWSQDSRLFERTVDVLVLDERHLVVPKKPPRINSVETVVYSY